MKKDQLTNVISSIRDGKVNREEVLRLLVDGSAEEKIRLALFIGNHRIGDFFEALVEAFEMELDPEIRGLYYWVITLLATPSFTENLVQWIVDEDNEDTKKSMIESFLTFTDRHDIPLETIKVEDGKAMEISAPPRDPISRISQFHKTIDSKEVLDLLTQFRPRIPVSLQRISSILNVETNDLIAVLERLDQEGILPGEYLRLEQVFIRDIKGPKTVRCASCGSLTTTFPCSECGGGKICATCRLPIDEREEILSCPNCKAPSHKGHLLEWIKIKGSCPSCRTPFSSKTLESSAS